MSEPAVETAVSRRTFTCRGKDVLTLTVRRPVCHTLPPFTRFYERCAARIEKKCAAFAAHANSKDGQPMCGVSVRHQVTLCTERYISVLLDICFFDGLSSHSSRYAQIWDAAGALLSPSDLFIGGIHTRRRLLRTVLDTVRDAVSEGTVSAPVKSASALANGFRMQNCCLVPRGIAFFFPCGSFSDEKDGIPLFVLPSDSIRRLTKITF